MENQTVTSNITIPIGGMHCAACARRVEKAIGSLDGVVKASVNIATEKATVSYEPQKIRQSDIRELIEKIGFKALSVSKEAAVDEHKARKQKEIRILWIKFIAAA
ncbi:MAG: cation transporter, partial [Chitinispirillales bacterium]|nr:cation transporter [Chitinispirillales bacterium]